MSKTPYEIRLEVLALAKDIAVEHYYTNREKLINRWDREAENARSVGAPIPPMPEIPEFPTEEAIVEKAQFLSEYINGSGAKGPKQLLTE